MKTTLRVHQPPMLPQGLSNSPDEGDGRNTDLAFYFLMSTLVLGLLFFVVLGVWLSL